MESSVAVVAVPFPAQGHVNQLLHLSLLLASRGLSMHLAAPEPHLREARARVHGWDAEELVAVRFRALDIPGYASPSPDPSSPFPAHMLPLFEAFCDGGARAPLAALLEELSTSHRRVVVLHDRMAAFAAVEAARLPNCEAFGVHCLAASYNVGWMYPGHRLLLEHGLVFHPADACATKEFVALAKRMGQERRRAPGAGMVVNTCRALEGEFLDVLAQSSSSDGHKLFAVGPLSPVLSVPDSSTWAKSEEHTAPRHKCLSWLDKQPPSSVVYLSFGTTSTLRVEQVKELAAALRGSNQRFIWVLRDADRADMREPLLGARLGLAEAMTELGEEIARGVGMVVTEWAPQLEILAHSATAAFMSHCGWNSTMESLSHGKAVLAWPMHSDQPWDAELVCKYLRAGILVRPWENRNDVTPASAIREAIEKTMASEEGAAVRARAREIGEAVRAAVGVGGSSRRDMDDFVAYLTRWARNSIWGPPVSNPPPSHHHPISSLLIFPLSSSLHCFSQSSSTTSAPHRHTAARIGGGGGSQDPMEVVGGVSSRGYSPAPAPVRLRRLSPGEAGGGFLLLRASPGRLQAAVTRPARRALVVEARGRGWSDRRSQQQRAPSLPKIEDDGNPRFVIFIRTANVYFWYPLNIISGGTTAKIMLAAKDNFLGKYIYKDTLARNLAAVIYKDEDDIIDTAKAQYRVLKTDNEFRYGYKVVENGNLRSALTTSNVIELPKKEELKTVVDKVKDFFGDVTSGAKESFAQITGSATVEAEAAVEEEKPWVKERNERKRRQKQKQQQKQGISK
ncbi:hypothetical protein GUJ93_ZPchr0006g45863 [Zizania palustris]|uniref:cis-zeatin O-beta-D-glucosyltransferase n=1 Tax=Zizania palustris TaxID=103762 RepID=A0A8J5VL28_ZIZPA|nr:hypothetical protein GUJ93_ZPchr0006g45863 [Zizania palustris]